MELEDAHTRAIRAAAKLIERKLEEIEGWVVGKAPLITVDYVEDVSPEERKALLEYIERTRKRLSGLIAEIEVPKEEGSLKREVRGMLNTVWILLENLSPERLERFGGLPEEEAGLLRSHIETMLREYREIMNSMGEER
jgi:hypothetical protein